jgi:hypothetical protein
VSQGYAVVIDDWLLLPPPTVSRMLQDAHTSRLLLINIIKTLLSMQADTAAHNIECCCFRLSAALVDCSRRRSSGRPCCSP